METKELNKISKIVSELKEIDSQIEEIEKAALFVSDNKVKCNLALGISSISKRKKESSYSCDDEYSFFRIRIINDEDEDEDEFTIKEELSPKQLFEFFEMIVRQKQARKQFLIKKIKGFGLKIN